MARLVLSIQSMKAAQAGPDADSFRTKPNTAMVSEVAGRGRGLSAGSGSIAVFFRFLAAR